MPSVLVLNGEHITLKAGVYKTSSQGCSIIVDFLRDRCDVNVIDRRDVEKGALPTFDFVLFPGGNDHLLSFVLSSRFRDAIRRYVINGGNYVGICGGMLLAGWLGFCKMTFIGSLPYYIFYRLSKKRGKVKVIWNTQNLFNMNGQIDMVWAAGPCIEDSGSLISQAIFAENKSLLPIKNKACIVSGSYGKGFFVLFSPHPEYSTANIAPVMSCILTEFADKRKVRRITPEECGRLIEEPRVT